MKRKPEMHHHHHQSSQQHHGHHSRDRDVRMLSPPPPPASTLTPSSSVPSHIRSASPSDYPYPSSSREAFGLYGSAFRGMPHYGGSSRGAADPRSASYSPSRKGGRSGSNPGIDFIKLHFGQKAFGQILQPVCNNGLNM
jgi:hypothetical protein